MTSMDNLWALCFLVEEQRSNNKNGITATSKTKDTQENQHSMLQQIVKILNKNQEAIKRLISCSQMRNAPARLIRGASTYVCSNNLETSPTYVKIAYVWRKAEIECCQGIEGWSTCLVDVVDMAVSVTNFPHLFTTIGCEKHPVFILLCTWFAFPLTSFTFSFINLIGKKLLLYYCFVIFCGIYFLLVCFWYTIFFSFF